MQALVFTRPDSLRVVTATKPHTRACSHESIRFLRSQVYGSRRRRKCLAIASHAAFVDHPIRFRRLKGLRRVPRSLPTRAANLRSEKRFPAPSAAVVTFGP